MKQIQSGEVDVEIRGKLHNAATMAGWGFGNSQIILSHALAHTAGAVFKIPHSVCIGAMCWYSLMYNREVASERISDLAKLVGFTGENDVAIVLELDKDYKDNGFLLFSMGLKFNTMDYEKLYHDNVVEKIIDTKKIDDKKTDFFYLDRESGIVTISQSYYNRNWNFPFLIFPSNI